MSNLLFFWNFIGGVVDVSKQTNKPESTESKKDIEAKHTENEKKPDIVLDKEQDSLQRSQKSMLP